MAVERCTRCGKILYPNKTLIAYHGMLFCSSDCCFKHIYYSNVDYEYNLVQHGEKRKGQITSEDVKQILDNESEEVIGYDLGIDWPRCQFTKKQCDENCALYNDGTCALTKR